MIDIPINNPKSPILFINIAFIAALFAKTLEYQKLISKYEDKPTPSQPINICMKLSAEINISIKNVNIDKYPINLLKQGSPYIYSIEYICTSNEIVITTIIITEVSTSNKSAIFTLK